MSDRLNNVLSSIETHTGWGDLYASYTLTGVLATKRIKRYNCTKFTRWSQNVYCRFVVALPFPMAKDAKQLKILQVDLVFWKIDNSPPCWRCPIKYARCKIDTKPYTKLLLHPASLTICFTQMFTVIKKKITKTSINTFLQMAVTSSNKIQP